MGAKCWGRVTGPNPKDGEMFRLDGHDIGDAWYYEADDAVHVYFLTKPEASDGGWDIGHAATRDLVAWEYLGLALARGAPGSWDDKSLATGSVFSRDGRYWMAFTGHKLDEPLFVQRVGMAVSDDLVRWEKLPENPTSEADPAHYELVSTGRRTLTHWRDPFLLDTGEDVVQYVCARRTDGDISSRGTVGVARSTDMRSWESLPPLEHDRIAEEMEVPQVYAIDGRYYLVFCSHEQWLSPSYKSRFPGHAFRSTDYSMVGDSPLGPFRIHGTGEIIPTAPSPSRYASQIVRHDGEWFLLSTVRDGGGRTAVSDPVPIVADETGIHADVES